MWVGGERHAPAALAPGNMPGTHCTGGWVDSRGGMDGVRKITPLTGFDLRTVQLIVIRDTNYTIPALIYRLCAVQNV
jgi:hypothetical protein